MQCVLDLVSARALLPSAQADALHVIYHVREERSFSLPPPPLAAKYGVQAQHDSSIAVVTNRWTSQTTLWNGRRGSKPQTFVRAAIADAHAAPPCDFCAWQEYTAVSTFGRFQNAHAITAANLFPFRGQHGLAIFRHHDALTITEAQLGGLLDVASDWFAAAAAAAGPAAAEPQLLWNSGPRSGASQAHGHAQLLLLDAPLPEVASRRAASQRFAAEVGGSLSAATEAAHAAVGLLRTVGDAAIHAPLTPLKDMELCVRGSSAASPHFRALLHAGLRALLDRAGVTSFNVTVEGWREGEGASARMVSRGRIGSNSIASDFGALELFGGASIGHTQPWAVMALVDAELASRADRSAAPASVEDAA